MTVRAMKTVNRATIDDLYRVPENAKAELVDGEIVRMSPTGTLPSAASGAIYVSLREYQRAHAAAERMATTSDSWSICHVVDPSRRMPHFTGIPASP